MLFNQVAKQHLLFKTNQKQYTQVLLPVSQNQSTAPGGGLLH